MGRQIFRAFKVPDREVLEALRRIVNDAGMGGPNVHLQFGSEGNSVEVPLAGAETHPVVAPIVAADSAIVYRIAMNWGNNYSLAVQRAAGSDEVTVAYPEGAEDVRQATARLLASVHKNLRAYGRTAAVDEVLGEELAEYYRIREDTLQQLQSLTARMIETNEQHRLRLEERTELERRRLQEEHERRLQELAAEHKRKADALADREAAFESRLAELDDRSSRHARRQLRQDLKQVLAQRTAAFTLSKDTSQKRRPIHALFIGLIAVSTLLFAYALTGYLPTSSVLPSWVNVIRLPLLALTLAASVIFYIRWSDQWFRQHADEEMRLKRLELDIDRASWVVEMALEWKDEKGNEIPAELIDRLSRNLFETEPASRVRHPTEDVMSVLLGASSELNLKTAFGEAKLDRKGIAKAKQALENPAG